jgi:hypothetical protein
MQNRPVYYVPNFKTKTNKYFSIQNAITTATMQYNSGTLVSGETFLLCIAAGIERLKEKDKYQ